MHDLIIVGAGPAGLSAALYALRANKRVLIFEAKIYGGQIINASKIENYPGIASISGFDFANNLFNQIKELGAKIINETVIRIDKDKKVITNNGIYEAKAIIIATGRENKKLGLPNEHEFIGRGISYCATCDGNFYKNKIVAVIGGGNTALTDAIYLSDIASRVYLIHRRDTFKGDLKYLEELKNKNNVKIILNSNVVSIEGEKIIEKIKLENNDKTLNDLKVEGLFIAVGQEPNNHIFSNLITLDDNGYIKSEDGVHTNIEGIYVAGDARVKELRQLVTAVSDGAIAATIALKEMRKTNESD